MKCRATNRAGKPCGAPAVEGSSCCVMHSGRAAELGRKGGRRRAVYAPDALKDFVPPKTASDLCELLAESIIEVRTGKLDPKVANVLGYLGASLLQALKVSDIEQRLQALERQEQVQENMVLANHVAGIDDGKEGENLRYGINSGSTSKAGKKASVHQVVGNATLDRKP